MAAVTAAVIGAGTALYTTSQAKKQQKKAQNFAEKQMEQLDPFAEYRPAFAKQLMELKSPDPTKIQDTNLYKARLQAAERQLASQGYTGSGNALAAAAEVGGEVYQQELENYMKKIDQLSILSGAQGGQAARASGYGTAAGATGAANDNYLSGLAGVGNNLTNLASMFGRGGGGSTVSTAPAGGWGAFTPNTGGFGAGSGGGFNVGALGTGPSMGSTWNFGGG